MTRAGQITIADRFNGPLESGNGGYSAGLLAGRVAGPAMVNLRSPVPLDRPLTVVSDGDGSTRALDGEIVVMEARPAPELDLEPPRTVSIGEAREAAGRYRGLEDGPFSRCFVCGRAREDALGVFAGRVDSGLVASPWTPDRWTAGADGTVGAEFVSAVLDCPTYFALYDDPTTVSFLAAMQVRIDGPVEAAGVEHVVVAWPIVKDGRKHHAGAAVLSADGRTLAVARALLIAAPA